MKQPCIFIDSETISDALTEQGNPAFFAKQIGELINAGYVVEAGKEPGHVENHKFTHAINFQTWFKELEEVMASSNDGPDDTEDPIDDEAEFYERVAQMEANGENQVDESLSPKQMDQAERLAGERSD